MTRKTHISVGEAAALLLIHPRTPKELVLCLGTAAIGSLISDVDSTSSKSHKELNTLLSVTAFAVVTASYLELHYDLGILRLLQQETSLSRILLGLLPLLLICSYGMKCPHRSFMHSLPCLFLLSFLIWEVFPTLLPAFFIGMLSHLLLDLTNRRGLQLFYPLKWRFCLKLWPSQGRMNDLICDLGVAGVLAGLSFSFMLMFL